MQQSIDRLAEICATRDAEHLRRFIKRHINMFGAYNRVALLAATISAAGTMRQAQQELEMTGERIDEDRVVNRTAALVASRHYTWPPEPNLSRWLISAATAVCSGYLPAGTDERGIVMRTSDGRALTLTEDGALLLLAN